MGISPAPAGRRLLQPLYIFDGKDQPRACGEKCGSRPPAGCRRGSAPRLRGEEYSERDAQVPDGISPAPCGEKPPISPAPTLAGGSAPRLRGEDDMEVSLSKVDRISPAPAGRRRYYNCEENLTQDQPRACGEKFTICNPVKLAAGSAPRLRGEVVALVTKSVRRRISPAPAGRSRRRSEIRPDRRDQPRACGEKKKLASSSWRVAGSAPRLRGEADPSRPYGP